MAHDIQLKNVSFTYPGGFTAVENVSLTIKQGEKVAIVGQNGAGKTTTVKMMDGLNKPTLGDVLVGDMNTRNYTTAQISRFVGYVFQNQELRRQRRRRLCGGAGGVHHQRSACLRHRRPAGHGREGIA